MLRSIKSFARGTAFRRALLLLLLLGLIGGGVWWSYIFGPTSAQRLDTVKAVLAEQLGTDVTLEAVRLAGLGRIAIDGVRIDGDVAVDVDRIVAAFSLRDWWRHRDTPLAGLRWVRVDGLSVDVPEHLLEDVLTSVWPGSGLFSSGDVGEDESGKLGEQRDDRAVAEPEGLSFGRVADVLDMLAAYDWSEGALDVYVRDGWIGAGPQGADVDGTVVLEKGRIGLRNVEIGAGDWQGAINGGVWPRAEVYARLDGAAGSLAPAGLHIASDQSWQGEVWLSGAWHDVQAWGTAHASSLIVQPDGEFVYEADELTAKWAYRPRQGVDLTVDVARNEARLQLEGNVAEDGLLDVSVNGTNVHVPDDVPHIGQWDVTGYVDMHGVLAGTVHAPVLVADVVADGGYLFGAPFTGLRGTMALRTHNFRFDRVRVTQGHADYFLDGRIDFATTDETGEVPARLDLTVRTDDGRAEALTDVLGWDIPLRSALAGVMRFEGPFGNIAAVGDLTLSRGSGWGQPFDELQGAFNYEDGAFRVTDVTGALRGGTVTASGGSDSAVGAGWSLDVAVHDVPVQAAPFVRERLPSLSGLISFDGTVAVGDDGLNPHVAGTFSGRHLFVGSFDFTEASGTIELRDGTLSSKGLTLQRRNGGLYDVSGNVLDVFGMPALDVSIDVTGESVGQLLAVTDWRLPLLAHSEPLQAQVYLQGTPTSPEATARVASDAMYVVGRSVPLEMDLRWRDGRIEVERMSGINSVQVNADSS